MEPLAIAADDLLVAEPELAAPPPMAVVTAPDAAPARTRRSERGRPSALLAAQAASEYVYVAQDLRRIAAVAGLIFGLLLALWLIIGVAGLSPV